MSSATARPRPTVAAERAAAAQLFHALSDETRLAVLEMLRGGERCVCELQNSLDAAQSRLSFHLRVLKDAGLVTDRKEGRWSYYALRRDGVAEAETALRDVTTPTARAASPTLHPLQRASRVAPALVKPSAVSRSGKASRNDCC